jgi:hypothetical protein
MNDSDLQTIITDQQGLIDDLANRVTKLKRDRTNLRDALDRQTHTLKEMRKITKDAHHYMEDAAQQIWPKVRRITLLSRIIELEQREQDI